MYRLQAKFHSKLIIDIGGIFDFPNGKLVKSIDDNAMRAVEYLCESFKDFQNAPSYKKFREELIRFSNNVAPGKDMSGELSFFKQVSDYIEETGLSKNIFIVTPYYGITENKINICLKNTEKQQQ